MTVVINKWGHSLGLRIPKDLAQKNDIQEGTEIEFLETPDGILIRKKQKKISGTIIVNQIRTLDFRTRNVQQIDTLVDLDIYDQVVNIINLMVVS